MVARMGVVSLSSVFGNLRASRQSWTPGARVPGEEGVADRLADCGLGHGGRVEHTHLMPWESSNGGCRTHLNPSSGRPGKAAACH